MIAYDITLCLDVFVIAFVTSAKCNLYRHAELVSASHQTLPHA